MAQDSILIGKVRRLLFELTRGDIKQLLLEAGVSPDRILPIPIINNMKSPQYRSKKELVSLMFDAEFVERDGGEATRLLSKIVEGLENRNVDVSELKATLSERKHDITTGEEDHILPSRSKQNRVSTSADATSGYDVFISHASEDKISIVRPPAELLRNAGLRVWYDEFSLAIGDSLRRSIDYGLANSRYGLVVLSQNFFGKEWPQKELDALSARETGETKVILPIWHDVSRKQVLRYSPLLADRYALQTSSGIQSVAQKIIDIVKPFNERAGDRVDVTPESKTKKTGLYEPDSTVFFSERIAKAFPGVRGLSWLESPTECIERLSVLLQNDLPPI